MKCFRFYSFAFFALLGVFFGSFIINQNSVSAVSDLTVTYTAGTELPASTYFFPDIDYSQYNYIYFNFSNPSSSLSHKSTFNIRAACMYNSSIYSMSYYLVYNDIYFALNDIKSCSNFSSNPNNSTTLLSDLTITLTDKIPSFGGSSPSGSLEITENGTYDVTNYAEAVVNVPETDCPPSSGGDYHNDLVAINNSIIICAATCLVIYFFYCIYRMIIKNSGVK